MCVTLDLEDPKDLGRPTTNSEGRPSRKRDGRLSCGGISRRYIYLGCPTTHSEISRCVNISCSRCSQCSFVCRRNKLNRSSDSSRRVLRDSSFLKLTSKHPFRQSLTRRNRRRQLVRRSVPLHLCNLDRGDTRVGLARDRDGGSRQPVGQQLLGVVFSNSCGRVRRMSGDRCSITRNVRLADMMMNMERLKTILRTPRTLLMYQTSEYAGVASEAARMGRLREFGAWG